MQRSFSISTLFKAPALNSGTVFCFGLNKCSYLTFFGSSSKTEHYTAKFQGRIPKSGTKELQYMISYAVIQCFQMAKSASLFIRWGEIRMFHQYQRPASSQCDKRYGWLWHHLKQAFVCICLCKGTVFSVEIQELFCHLKIFLEVYQHMAPALFSQWTLFITKTELSKASNDVVFLFSPPAIMNHGKRQLTICLQDKKRHACYRFLFFCKSLRTRCIWHHHHQHLTSGSLPMTSGASCCRLVRYYQSFVTASNDLLKIEMVFGTKMSSNHTGAINNVN